MINKKLLLKIFVLLISCFYIHAQTIKRFDDLLLFNDAKTQKPVVIINDSLVYKNGKAIPFKHTNYPEKLSEYLPFEIDTKTYLVHKGCGPVLEFRNDSLVRIDKSFLHKNQFGAVTFTYNNKLYFWGGYGLFTHKNILTQFNIKTKEWVEIKTSGKLPSARSYAHGFLVDDYLYVFGGYEKDNVHFLQSKVCALELHKLHLPTMQWSIVGEHTFLNNLNTLEDIATNFSAGSKHYILPLKSYNTIYEIDIKNNTVITYQSGIKDVSFPYHDAKTNGVIYLNKNHEQYKVFVRTSFKEFLGKSINQQKFVLPWYQSIAMSTIIYVLVGVFSLLGFVLFFNSKKKKFVPFTGIIYYATKDAFYYKGKLLDAFEVPEKRILEYLVQNKHHYISLNELNNLFENDVLKDSFLTVVKRREVALANLLAKLGFITSGDEQDIVDYRRSSNDKRVKEIKLKDTFIKIK